MAITFEYEDEVYTLEFSRRTVGMMENAGFKLEDLVDKQVTRLPQLFAGAFLMHHPRMKEEKINKIYKDMGDKDQLFTELIDLYRVPIEAMYDEPEDDSKKVKWKKV